MERILYDLRQAIFVRQDGDELYSLIGLEEDRDVIYIDKIVDFEKRDDKALIRGAFANYMVPMDKACIGQRGIELLAQ